ncbi:unnamed protein product [Tuber aestivum]|uniref:NB-ARC domain-containing protein n=1 Tax=Tuber aestivum TaxID=59557 RepID=A0A292PJ09_9PEZI|nr:unnamed protein product [Tuber aestivum]
MSIILENTLPCALQNIIRQAGMCIFFTGFIDIAESEQLWKGNIRMLGEYGGHSCPDVLHVGHFRASSPKGAHATPPADWTYSHHEVQTLIPHGKGIIELIRSDPEKAIAELKANNFDGIAFYGASGIRKTQTAVQFMQACCQHIYNIFWADASTLTTITTHFQYTSDLLEIDARCDTSPHTRLANQMRNGAQVAPGSTNKRFSTHDNLTDKTASTKDTGSSMENGTSSSRENLPPTIRSKLESPSTGNWLLVLDNLTEEAAIAKSLPKTPNGTIIVTTRSLQLVSRLDCRAVGARRMSPGSAALLFEINYLNPEGSEMKQDEAMELVEFLEYLPAKIADAALDMSKNRVSVREYLAELKAVRRLLESSRPWRCSRPDWIYGCWNGAAPAVAWGCFVIFSILSAWAIGFRRG